MEALAVLFVLFLLVVVFVFPLWAFIRIRRQGDDLEQLRRQVATLQEQLRESPRVATSPAPSAAIESAFVPPSAAATVAPLSVAPPPVPPAVAAPAAPALSSGMSTPDAAPAAPGATQVPPPLPPSAAAAPRPTAALPPVTPAAPLASGTRSAPDAESVRATPPTYVPPQRKAAPALNLEQFMGVKLFAWLGGLALFLGAVFFVKHSIEQGWIPPEVRVALAFLLGAGLVLGGVILKAKRYAVTAQTLCATGIVTLYAVTFACRSLYDFSFFTPGITFGLMVLITATAFLLAVRMQAQLVALLGMLGGFLTPILVPTGQNNPVGLFAYIALLDVGLLAVALHRRWLYLVPLSAFCTALMLVAWATRFPLTQNASTAIIVCLGFNLLYLAGFAVGRRRGVAGPLLSLPVAGLVLVSFAFAWYFGVETPIGYLPGRWLSFLFAADLCVLALALLDFRTARLQTASGVAVFALLAGWTTARLNADLLGWALAAYLVFAVLHAAFPLVLQRLKPEAEATRGHLLFPALALLLVLGPILNSPHASAFAIWPAILLIDVLAIAIAWVTASTIGVMAVLILTLVAAAQSVFRLPVGDAGGGLLLLIAGFACLFFVAGLALVRRFNAGQATDPDAAQADRLRAQLPMVATLLPFILLVLAVTRLALPSPSPVFGLSLLLTVLTLGLARQLGRGGLALCALAGVLTVAYAWHARSFSAANAGIAVGWYAGFSLLFAAFPFVFHRLFAGVRLPWIASAVAAPAFFPLVYNAVVNVWPNNVMGLLAAAFALPAMVLVFAVLRLDPPEHPRRLGRLALYGGVALFFITLVFPLQFDRQWVTIAWAVEGVALLWLYHRVTHRGLPIAGSILLLVAFARLALNPAVLSYHAGGGTRIFNWYLYTYGIVALCLLAGAKFLAPPRDRVLGFRANGFLVAAAGILLFLLLNIEIADYFSGTYHTLTFDFSGNFARDMSYTIGWALYAFALLIVGIWKNARGARYAAIGLLAVTLAKLFLRDLSHLGAMYKIGALFAVAVIAILTSVLYQRFVPPDEKAPPSP